MLLSVLQWHYILTKPFVTLRLGIYVIYFVLKSAAFWVINKHKYMNMQVHKIVIKVASFAMVSL